MLCSRHFPFSILVLRTYCCSIHPLIAIDRSILEKRREEKHHLGCISSTFDVWCTYFVLSSRTTYLSLFSQAKLREETRGIQSIALSCSAFIYAATRCSSPLWANRTDGSQPKCQSSVRTHPVSTIPAFEGSSGKVKGRDIIQQASYG